MVCIPNIGPDWMIEEDIKFKAYLASHGYDVGQIGEPEYRDENKIEADKYHQTLVTEKPV